MPRLCLVMLPAIAVAMVLITPGVAKAEPITSAMLEFRYQELNEPWNSYKCDHYAAPAIFDWIVKCRVNDQVKGFVVHLVVSFYPRTRLGNSAYEVLYWLTSREANHKYQSSTVWIHNTKPEARASVFELSQGIENDFAALNLTIDLR